MQFKVLTLLYKLHWTSSQMFLNVKMQNCSNTITYLVGLCIIRTLSILGLFDIFYHLPKKGMTVVLILGHQHFKHEPQASIYEHTHTQNKYSLCHSCAIITYLYSLDFIIGQKSNLEIRAFLERQSQRETKSKHTHSLMSLSCSYSCGFVKSGS